MKPEADSILMSVAEAVADGLPVDWDGLIAAQPEAAEQLRLLRLQQTIMNAHLELVTKKPGPDPDGGQPER